MQRYFQTNSIASTQRCYHSTYGPPASSSDSIRRWHDNFIRFRIATDRQISGRLPVSLEDVREIENVFNENPRLSTRNAERNELKMFPYKISFLQELPIDYVDRLNWSGYCRREIRKDSQYLSRIVFLG